MLLFIAEKRVLEKMNKLLDKWSMKKLKVKCQDSGERKRPVTQQKASLWLAHLKKNTNI